MSRIGSTLLLFSFWITPAFAQPITSVEQMPPLDRGHEDFYGVIVGAGPRVQVEWLLSPISIERGGEAILTLIVMNAANPKELQRPMLADRPEWRELFDVIEDLPEVEHAKRVEFRYKLRPRNAGMFNLPLLRYRYYQPQAPEGRRFQLAASVELNLTVTEPASTKKTEPVSINAPREFLEFRTSNDFPAQPTAGSWLALVTVPSIVGLLWFSRWRRRHPDRARMARMSKVRQVQKALDELRYAKDARTVASAFREYLVGRVGVTPECRTPSDVANSLKTLVTPDAADEAERILNECDRELYADTAIESPDLNDAAIAWIMRHEGEGNP